VSDKLELCFANKYSSSEPLVIHTGTLIVINIKKAISAEFCILLLNVNILRMFFFSWGNQENVLNYKAKITLEIALFSILRKME